MAKTIVCYAFRKKGATKVFYICCSRVI